MKSLKSYNKNVLFQPAERRLKKYDFFFWGITPITPIPLPFAYGLVS